MKSQVYLFVFFYIRLSSNFNTVCWNNFYFLSELFLFKVNWPCLYGDVSEFYSVPLIYLYFLIIRLNSTLAVFIQVVVWKYSKFVFFFPKFFDYFKYFDFPYKYNNKLVNFYWKSHLNFDWDYIDAIDQFGWNWCLRVF